MQCGLWPGEKSRMSREAPVRFREGLGVKFPRATRLVMGFACEADARRVLEVLPKRFGKYGLTLHPEKTRLVPFRQGSAHPVGSAAGTATRDVRPVGVSPLLGADTVRDLGRAAQDGAESFSASAREDRSVVPGQPAPADCGAASRTVAESAWSQCLLWNHGQPHGVAAVPVRGDAPLAEVAVPPSSTGSASVASLSDRAAAVPAAAAARGALGVPSCSQAVMGRAVCVQGARTDLWEPRVGNRPG
jgi:hypothetical protein